MVKRLTALPGDTVNPGLVLPAGQAWVLSDNDREGVVDSRTFGPVDFRALRPVVTKLDERTFVEGADLLSAEDPHLRSIIDEFAIPPFWSRPPGFATLVLLILEQQVSLESGAAVFKRLQDLTGPVTAESTSTFSVGDLNAIGLTRQKAGYVIGLARSVLDGEVDLGIIGQMPTSEALAVLQTLRGIGPWTAEAYLLSAECVPDLFPTGDRALQVGTAEALGLSTVPRGKDLEMLAEPWRPIRSVAARILWHGYLRRRGREEHPHPFPVHADRHKA
jgi:DNA-3-methyladenine glycosylase II